MDGSYQLSNFTESVDSEVKRLQAQVELFFDQEFKTYKSLGLREGMKIIECGSGPGYLVLNIARQCPTAQISALEIDPFLFEKLKENSDNGRFYTAVQGSIYDTKFPENHFDIVITRLVIEHLDKPGEAIHELTRILKPGGKLIITSNDFDYHVLTYPHIGELQEMFNAYCKFRKDQGGNPYVGRELPVYLQKAGFTDILINTVCAHSKVNGDSALLKAENVNISRNLVKEGYLKQATLDALTNKWFDMIQHPDHAIYRQLFMVSGTKGFAPEKNDEKNNVSKQSAQAQNIISGNKLSELRDLLVAKMQDVMEDPKLEIKENEKLSEYYIDSLAATNLASFVKKEFNTSLKLSDILENYSVEDIARKILSGTSNEVNLKNGEQSTWTEGEL